MYHRFTATKEAIELNSIRELKNKDTPFVIKKEDAFKGVSFFLTWDRIEQDLFRLTCFHKGAFNVLSPEFVELLETYPFSVINTITLKELFAVDYRLDPDKKAKDIVYTHELKYKFLDLFESEEVILHYVSQLVAAFGWKIQIKEEYSETWNDYIA
jgi:hypothetical protein